MEISEIIKRAKTGEDVTSLLKQKSISLPAWADLKKEYDPKLHPVMDEAKYPDITIYEEQPSSETDEFGNPKKIRVAKDVERVSRVTYALQDLAVKRTVELCFGIPVRRVYKPDANDERQKEVAGYLEKIYDAVRINSVNIDRGRQLFASCEIMTLWYPVKQDTSIYGFNSKIKLRCVTYSPMLGDEIYPLFDETGDLLALSVSYIRKVKEETISYFDVYTDDTHLRWETSSESGANELTVKEEITLGKIPAIYIYRPSPVWENTSPLVYEMEWAMSRNGNYLRKNSRPILMAAVSEEIQFGQSPSTDAAFRDIVQYPQGSSLQYVTWNQAIDNLKFYEESLRRTFFTQLQLPDISYDNMKTTPMSGEARKQLFIDCQLKVKDESGRWLEFFDREMKVVKGFLKIALGNKSEYNKAIDDLVVENVITPFTITDEKDTVNILLMKNGNKPLMSQRESIEALGESDDVEQTLNEIRQESVADLMEPTM